MKGHLAICNAGFLGLMTTDTPQCTPYSGSYQDVAYPGMHLTDARGEFGSYWQSKNPKVLCRIDDTRAGAIIRRFQLDKRWGNYPGDHMRVRGFCSNDRLMLVESVDGDRYEHEHLKWSRIAGTAAA